MSVSQDAIWTRLQEIRAKGDCPMVMPPVIRPWDPVTETGFLDNAPHRVGIAHLRLRPRFMLLDPTGTGKTPQTLVAFGMMWAQTPPGARLKMLVLCGKTAQFQWRDAVEKFLIGPTAKVVGYNARDKKVDGDLRVLDYHDPKYDILLTTYATFAGDIDAIRDMDLQRLLVVCDEAHKLKGLTQSTLRPAMTAINDHARALWLLTASPVHRQIVDLYSMADLIRPGMLGNERQFADRYLDRVWVSFLPKGRRRPGFQKGPGKWHVKAYKNMDELRALLDPWMIARPLSAFAGQIPDFRVVQSEVTLATDHRALYNDVVAKRFPVSGLPMNPLAAVTYTQMMVDAPQVLGYDTVSPPAKLAELLRLLRDDYAGDRVLVFSRYATVCVWLQQELLKAGISTGLLTGSVPADERLAAIRAFQDGPSPEAANHAPQPATLAATSVLVLSAAGGESLNLQQARVMVLYDLPWAGGSLLQLLGRNRRHGSRYQSVLFHLLTAEGTVDTVTPAVLHDQLSLISSLNLHSTSTSPHQPTSPIHDTDNDSSALAIASAIASEIRRPSHLKKISTVQLEAVLREVTGSGPLAQGPFAAPDGLGQFPSSEEAVNSEPTATYPVASSEKPDA